MECVAGAITLARTPQDSGVSGCSLSLSLLFLFCLFLAALDPVVRLGREVWRYWSILWTTRPTSLPLFGYIFPVLLCSVLYPYSPSVLPPQVILSSSRWPCCPGPGIDCAVLSCSCLASTVFLPRSRRQGTLQLYNLSSGTDLGHLEVEVAWSQDTQGYVAHCLRAYVFKFRFVVVRGCVRWRARRSYAALLPRPPWTSTALVVLPHHARRRRRLGSGARRAFPLTPPVHRLPLRARLALRLAPLLHLSASHTHRHLHSRTHVPRPSPPLRPQPQPATGLGALSPQQTQVLLPATRECVPGPTTDPVGVLVTQVTPRRHW